MKREKGAGVYNLVVLGAGTAGLVAAAGTASLGGRVALIERGEMGGDCLNFGCVPSKALISSARLAQRMREAEKWGLDKHEPRFEFNRVLERMRERRAVIAPNDSQERLEKLGVDVFRGEGKFTSPHEVEVEGLRLRARNFVIATGTRPAIPTIRGIESVPYFTNETIFDELGEHPKNLAIIGGGPIGCELGQAFRRLGSEVTIFNRGPRILAKEDPEVSAFIQEKLEAEGVRILNGREIQSAGELSASVILIASGRTPNIDGLECEAAGVKTSERGVITNAWLQTSQPHIYAAGDVAGPFHFTHMADHQARIVVRNTLVPFQFLRQKVDYSAVPWCTFVDPEVARAGLNETQAREMKIEFDSVTQQFSEIDRAVVESAESGFAKILLKRGTDKILGVTIVAEQGGELIHEFILAMKHGIGLGQIAATIHVYPTLAEVARKAGDQYNKRRLTPRARKIFSWLYGRGRKGAAL